MTTMVNPSGIEYHNWSQVRRLVDEWLELKLENLDISGKSHARRNLLSVLVDADITLDSNLRICFLFWLFFRFDCLGKALLGSSDCPLTFGTLGYSWGQSAPLVSEYEFSWVWYGVTVGWWFSAFFHHMFPSSFTVCGGMFCKWPPGFRPELFGSQFLVAKSWLATAWLNQGCPPKDGSASAQRLVAYPDQPLFWREPIKRWNPRCAPKI